MQVRLQELGAGDSQALLVRLRVGPAKSTQRPVATVTLSYFDVFAQRPERIEREVIAVSGGEEGAYDPLRDLEVLRNVTIQRTAEGLREIDRLYRQRRFADAWRLARELETRLREVAALTGDEALYKDADLLRRYQNVLGEPLREEGGAIPYGSKETTPSPSYERYLAPTPSVPVIEVG